MKNLLDEILGSSYFEVESSGITKRPPHYSQMSKYYPKGSASQVKRLIGGYVDRDSIRNTCVVRVSRALNYTDHPIPRNFTGLTTLRGGDNKRYAVRVKEFKKYLSATYGQPDLTHENSYLSNLIPLSFKGKKGIILFEVDSWSNATGHITLWDGSRCINNDCYWNKAKKVYLWVSSPLLNPFID